jgi:hypothetical protein
VRRSEEEWGGVRRSEEEWGGVRRSEEECGRVMTSLIINIRHNYMHWRHAGELKHDRSKLADYACFSVPHVYGTIEGLMLAYYDWLFDLTSVSIKSTRVLEQASSIFWHRSYWRSFGKLLKFILLVELTFIGCWKIKFFEGKHGTATSGKLVVRWLCLFTAKYLRQA